jgi:hypothetical protein
LHFFVSGAPLASSCRYHRIRSQAFPAARVAEAYGALTRWILRAIELMIELSEKVPGRTNRSQISKLYLRPAISTLADFMPDYPGFFR